MILGENRLTNGYGLNGYGYGYGYGLKYRERHSIIYEVSLNNFALTL
jgi:hypothetical protein